MDRNKYVVQCRKTLGVALRKESVDRNCHCRDDVSNQCVALRKESVDRNFDYIIRLYRRIVSLSARRAWIEMC